MGLPLSGLRVLMDYVVTWAVRTGRRGTGRLILTLEVGTVI